MFRREPFSLHTGNGASSLSPQMSPIMGRSIWSESPTAANSWPSVFTFSDNDIAKAAAESIHDTENIPPPSAVETSKSAEEEFDVYKFSSQLPFMDLPSPFLPPSNPPKSKLPSKVLSKKVFVGGIPIGTTELELHDSFLQFGMNAVTWPNRQMEETCPPNGYAFVIFDEESAALALFEECCLNTNGKLVFAMGAATMRLPKYVELKFWEVKDATHVGLPNWRQYARHSTFVGGLPRSCTAAQLSETLEEAIGPIAHVAIEVDSITQYPRGAARVIFASHEYFLMAVAMREMYVTIENSTRKIEMKPFLYPNMLCDKCSSPCGSLFCGEIRCLKYFCSNCWKKCHEKPGLTTHVPMRRNGQSSHVKKGTRV